MIQQRIEQDLKTALLAGDQTQVSVLRSIKSAIIYAEVAKGVKGTVGLSDDDVLNVLAKQAKQRQESADAYTKAGQADRANAELAEKEIVDRYLPRALSKEEVETLIDQVVESIGGLSQQKMGQVIGQVKQQAGASADGALIAKLVKERLSQ